MRLDRVSIHSFWPITLGPGARYRGGMASVGFQFLPVEIQQLVTDGLDEEVRSAFSEIETAMEAGDQDLVRAIQKGIARVSELRQGLTGEAVVID